MEKNCKLYFLKSKKRTLIYLVTGIACLFIVFCIKINIRSTGLITVYAKGNDYPITDSWVELRTGSISDQGEMKGNLFQMYVKGEMIDNIRFYCKNQYINFTDWTEVRDSYSMAKNFTIPYGKNKEDYYYLLIEWIPEETIRILTENDDIDIKSLEENLRNDTIVMQINFIDGRRATKAIYIKLLDNGKIVASFEDYNILIDDDFILSNYNNADSKINQHIKISINTLDVKI